MPYKKRNTRKRKTYRKKVKSVKKEIQSYINSHADRKFTKEKLSTGTASLPSYVITSNPFAAYDLINLPTGVGNEARIGQRVTCLRGNLRLSFELPPTATDTVGFVRYFVVMWPNKHTTTVPNDMHAVLEELSSTGTSQSFATLFNSPYNSEPTTAWKMLKHGSFSMVKNTATQMKSMNINLPVKNVVLDFGPTGYLAPPNFNRISLYLMSDNNDIRYSYYTKFTYIDI